MSIFQFSYLWEECSSLRKLMFCLAMMQNCVLDRNSVFVCEVLYVYCCYQSKGSTAVIGAPHIYCMCYVLVVCHGESI